MTKLPIDNALDLMTNLGVQPKQAEAFIEAVRNPHLITDEQSLTDKFLKAGYDQLMAQALAKFLIAEKSQGRL